MEGRPADRMPVTSMYLPLYQLDHFVELSGRPAWEIDKWRSAPPDEHVKLFLEMRSKTPFDLVQPHGSGSREARENAEYVERDGRMFRRDKRTGDLTPVLTETTSGHATDYRATEEQIVFDKADVNAKVVVRKAEEAIAEGANDYLEAVVRAVGDKEFIVSGGLVGVVWYCGQYVGQSNVFAMMKEQPDLIEYLSWKLVEANIEEIRRMAAGGGDAIYIDDATATSDMISVAQYERFSMPFVKAMVEEIHRQGLKVILIYFGGIADRLEQIVSIGADALAPEASMKGYVNDINAFAEKIGSRTTLFGNVDPLNVLEKASDEGLEAEVQRQVAAGRKARGFVVCTGSPITPKTPLSRVQRFIALAHKYGAA